MADIVKKKPVEVILPESEFINDFSETMKVPEYKCSCN